MTSALRVRRRPKPERLDARGWDLALLGALIFALILGVVYTVSRYSVG